MTNIHSSAFLALDDEEEALMSSLDSGEWKSVSSENSEKTKKLLQESAEYYSQKTKPISIRLQKTVLGKLKEKSRYNGLSYQTILSLLAKQYTDGKIQLHI